MARSIILRKHELGEADELVVFVARELGWLRGVAKNARKSRVRFGGHLEPFSLVDLVLRPRKRDDLVWIDDSQAINGFLGLRSHLGKVAIAAYFLELASIFQGEAQPDPAVFDFLLKLLERLESSPVNAVRVMLEEIRLLGMLGYAPRFDVCPACGEPIGPGEKAVFSPYLGGAAHERCVDPRGPQIILSPNTLALVRRGLAVEDKAASRLRLNRKGMEELRNALSEFVRALRGKEINSLVFLEKTGLWVGGSYPAAQ